MTRSASAAAPRAMRRRRSRRCVMRRPRRRACALPAISSPSLTISTSARSVMPTMRPSRDHADAVADAQHLLELGRDVEHGAAAVAQRQDGVDDEARRAGIESPGRLERDQHAGLAPDLAREHHLLLVAAGQRADRRVAARHAHAELSGALHRPACARRRRRASRSARMAAAATSRSARLSAMLMLCTRLVPLRSAGM